MKSIKVRLLIFGVSFLLLTGSSDAVANVFNSTIGYGISITEALIALMLVFLFRPGKTY